MPDGALVNDLALREQLVREIRTFRPDAVLATDPSVIFYRDGGINHTDHRAAGLAAVDAVYPAARNPMAFPALARAGLAAHKVRRLYLFWPNEPNVRVDISATLDRKIEALRAHASQIQEPDKLAERIRRVGRRGGRADRGRRGRGAPADRDRRRRGRGTGPTARSTPTEAPAARARREPRSARLEEDRPDRAPLVPELGQAVGPPAEERRPARRGSARRPPPATYSSAATRTSREELAHLRLGRPAPDAHRVEAGVARRRATGRAGSGRARRPSRRTRRTGTRATTGPRRCRGSGPG